MSSLHRWPSRARGSGHSGRTETDAAINVRPVKREYAMRRGPPLWEAGVAAAPPFSP